MHWSHKQLTLFISIVSSPSSPAPRVPRHRAPRDDLLAETHKKRLDRRGIGVFRRDNGPLNAAMVYPKIGVCWRSLRVAGAYYYPTTSTMEVFYPQPDS
jgi:hypothetical protein